MSKRWSNSEGTLLARPGSSSVIVDDTIKGATHRFDLEIVFKLALCLRGITAITGLSKCINLVDLNLSNNSIARIDGLGELLQLRRLNLSSNKIAKVEGLAHLEKLEVLQLQDNQIPSLEALALQQQLACLPSLRVLHLQQLDRSMQNPVCKLPGYKAALLAALPGLSNLDGERNPTSLSYAEMAGLMAAWQASPPPPKEWALPELTPWLTGGALELGGPAGMDPELEARHVALNKALDDCQMLQHVLREEIAKVQGALKEAKPAA